MKRFILLLLTFILTFTLTACSGGGGELLAEYSSTFSFDDEMHWRSQTNGTGSTDLGEHEDNGLGVCSVCGCVLYEINYASTFSFDDERHWRELPNGAGRTEEGVHTEIEEGGKCATCNYYYDATEFLSFEKCKIGNVNGYRVIEMLDQDFDEDYFPRHIEVPTHYQGEEDEEPLPVIGLGYAAFSTGVVNAKHYNDIAIKSIKLNEGLLEIRDWAFRGSAISELTIPNSTTNEYFINTGTANSYGALYNVGGALTKFSNGGIRVLSTYNFTNNVTKTIKLTDSLKTIAPRAFYEIYSLEYLVIPASVNRIPEGTVTGSGNYAKAALIRMFPDRCTTPIFMEITKEEHDALLVEPRKRDLQGNILDPLPKDSIGFVKGWSGNSPVYFKGEWHYSKWGKPIADV